MKFWKRKIRFVGCFAAFLLFVFSITAFADEHVYQLSVDYQYDSGAIAGAEFHFYKVGEISESGKMRLTGDYELFPVKVDVEKESELQTAVNTLYGYIQKEEMVPDREAVTNVQGKLLVDNLEKGIYLVAGQPYFSEEMIYTTQPQLITLPMGDLEHVVLDVKASAEQKQDEPVSVKVLKNWKDQNNIPERPAKVTIYLLKDGNVIDTVVLNRKNNWKFIWDGLNPNSQWSIVEEPVHGYLVTVERIGNTYLVTNTGTSETPPKGDGNEGEGDHDDPEDTTPSDTPSDSSNDGGETKNFSGDNKESQEDQEETFILQVLPQTGMIWWPVVLMVFAGTGCIVFGIVLCRRYKDE